MNIMKNFTFIMLSLSAVVTLMAFLLSGITLIRTKRLKIYDIAIIMTGIYFGIGPWVAYFYADRQFKSHKEILKCTENNLLLAFLSVILFMWGIWAVRFFSVLKTKKTDRADVYMQPMINVFKANFVNHISVIILAGSVWLLRCYIGISYGIFFSGSASKEKILSMPYIISSLYLLSITISIGFLLWSMATFWAEKRFSLKLTAFSISLLEFFWLFVHGRSHVLSWLVIGAFTYLAIKQRLTLKHLGMCLMISFVFIHFLFPFFLSARECYHRTKGQDYNSFKHTFKAIELAFKTDSARKKELMRVNISIRPLFLHGFLCEVFDGINKHPPMKGRVLMQSALCVVPSVLYPGKKELVQPEQLIQRHLGYPEHDFSCTWPAAGCADFGYAGGFVAGLIVGFFIMTANALAKVLLNRFPLIALSIIGGTITCVADVESTPTEIFLLFRNILVLIILAQVSKLIKMLFKKSFVNRNDR